MIGSWNILLGIGWAVAALTIFSGSFVMLRLGMTTSLNAYDLTALRFGVAALILAPVALMRGVRLKLGIWPLITMIMTFGAPYVLLLGLAAKSTPAAVLGALNPGAMAIVSVALGRAFFCDPIGGVRFTGLVITSTGIVLFTWAGGAFTSAHLILIVTGLMWASYNLIVRHAAVPALQATTIVAVGSAILYLPVYLVALPKQIPTAPLLDIALQAGFQGVLVSTVALYALNRFTELLGPAAGAALPALFPVATLGLGVIVLGETPGIDELIAAIWVAVGVALMLVGKPVIRWLSSHAWPIVKRQRQPKQP